MAGRRHSSTGESFQDQLDLSCGTSSMLTLNLPWHSAVLSSFRIFVSDFLMQVRLCLFFFFKLCLDIPLIDWTGLVNWLYMFMKAVILERCLPLPQWGKMLEGPGMLIYCRVFFFFSLSRMLVLWGGRKEKQFWRTLRK